MAVWTPDEDATIRARAKTHSAAQIAALLPGRSRASVTGRAWRLGESLAKDDITRRALEHPRRRARRSAPPKLGPAPSEAWPMASPTARRAALAVRPKLVALEALGPGECRWPYGADALRFCAHPVSGGGAYCGAHRGLAYIADPGAYDPESIAAEIERRERRVQVLSPAS